MFISFFFVVGVKAKTFLLLFNILSVSCHPPVGQVYHLVSPATHNTTSISVVQRNYLCTMKVFTQERVKADPYFFIAGRGGETNLHKPNAIVRQVVLENGRKYACLSKQERGQKFAQQLLDDELAGFTFVVNVSYFLRNQNKGKIASAKLNSIISEHGSIQALKLLPPYSYVTIGHTWTLNIVGAILRQAARYSKTPAQKFIWTAKARKTPTMSDGSGEAAQPVRQRVQKKIVYKTGQRKMASMGKDTPHCDGASITRSVLDLPQKSIADSFQYLCDSIQSGEVISFHDIEPDKPVLQCMHLHHSVDTFRLESTNPNQEGGFPYHCITPTSQPIPCDDDASVLCGDSSLSDQTDLSIENFFPDFWENEHCDSHLEMQGIF
jgi:hypothetical protein